MPYNTFLLRRQTNTLTRARNLEIGGQTLDVLYENSDKQCEELLYTIHEKKTAALLKAAMLAGAYAAGASDEELEKIRSDCLNGVLRCGDCKARTAELMEEFMDDLKDKQIEAREIAKTLI